MRGRARGNRNWYSTSPSTRGARSGIPYGARPTPAVPANRENCAIYTRTGSCDQGRSCKFKHDRNHVALCQAYFMSGRCSSTGTAPCSLSHTPVPQNTPMCSHYARGKCEKSDCRFTHMDNIGDVDNTAVCRQFALLGWCDKGASCNRRHAYDCPDFEAFQKCPNTKCKLQHVIKAQQPQSSAKPRIDEAARLAGQERINLDAFISFIRKAEPGDESAGRWQLRRTDLDEEPGSHDRRASDDEGDNNNNDKELLLDDLPEVEWDVADLEVERHNNDDGELDVNADFIQV